jgi:hypothetical protein
MSYGTKPDVVKCIKEAREKYAKRNIYCLVVDDEDFYAATAKWDVDKLLSSSDNWELSIENYEDIKAYHGFVLDVKNLPDELKSAYMKNRTILLFREFTQGNLVEVTELGSLAEAMDKIEKETAEDQADIDEYLILIGESCELCLTFKEASSNILIEREVYGD